MFTFGIGKKDFQIIQLKLYPSRDPMPFLSSAYWAAPTEKKHLTALTVNEANFVLFIKAPFPKMIKLITVSGMYFQICALNLTSFIVWEIGGGN